MQTSNELLVALAAKYNLPIAGDDWEFAVVKEAYRREFEVFCFTAFVLGIIDGHLRFFRNGFVQPYLRDALRRPT